MGNRDLRPNEQSQLQPPGRNARPIPQQNDGAPGAQSSRRDGVVEQPEIIWRSPWLVAVSWTAGL